MSSDRPFRILGLQQIAIGAPNKERLRHLWCDLFGLPLEKNWRSAQENVDEDIVRLGEGAHSIEIDLMQPIEREKSPRVDQPPLNHIGLWVDDLPAAVSYLEKKGVRFTAGGIRKGAAGHDICFIHPKANAENPLCGEGVLIELVQAPPELSLAIASP